jgi:hypothetical protein
MKVIMAALIGFCFVVFMFFRASIQNMDSTRPTFTQSAPASFESHVKKNFARSATRFANDNGSIINSSVEGKKINPQHSTSTTPVPKILVIYFPQYHPDPLNDKNWGANFTDWVSLQKSPLQNRLGFDIPRPTELGYYDLRDTAVRQKQGELAKQYGIDGFIYHHYWFYDRSHPGPNLEKPLVNMLQDGDPDVPFLLNWCATKWVNVWMGKAIFQTIPTNKNRAITLQEQFFDPTEEMVKEHYDWLNRFFKHPNYIKIGNQPVLMLYFYDPLAVPILKELRMFAKQDGWDGIYLIFGRSAYPDGLYDPSHLDEKLTKWVKNRMQHRNQFPTIQEGPFNQSLTYPYPLEYVNKPFEIPKWCLEGKDPSIHNPYEQEGTGVVTAFDNTPRREYATSTIYEGNGQTPEEKLQRFETNLYAALYYQRCCQKNGSIGQSFQNDPMEDRFVAVNSWNEWAEGMAIEPSTTYGRKWLETIQRVKKRLQGESCPFRG